MLGRIVSVASEELKYNWVTWRHQISNGTAESRAKVLVNGSPKTGTTWMYKMIGSLPGYEKIGNFDGDWPKYDTVQPGQVIHGHDWYTAELAEQYARNGIRLILMIRDPRDQLVSRMFHVKRSTSHSWNGRFAQMSIDEALTTCIEGGEGLPGMRTMIDLTQSWLNSDFPLLAIKYEELLAQPEHHFAQALRHIGLTQHVESLAEVIVERNRFERLSMGKRIWQNGRSPGQENKNSHFRKGISGDWKNYLKPHHITQFKAVAGDQLIELGYETDMNWTL